MALHPLEKIAKRYFGVTDSLEETGYVLSDGTFLDLTGRHIAVGYERKGDRFVPKKRQPDYLAFQRSIDHRQLPSEIFDAVGTREGSEAMFAFLRKTGALRLMPGAGFLAAAMPTHEAVARVVREWHHAFGDESLYVDVVYPDSPPSRASRVINPNDVRDSQEFEEPTVEGVMEFLESKFGGTSMGAARDRGRKAPVGNKTYWRPGEIAYFEYHCCQSHDSADAEIWYRSQQPVTVVGIADPGGGRTMMKRIDYNIPRMYRVRFLDGLEWTVFEDELLTSERYYDPAYAPGDRPSLGGLGGGMPPTLKAFGRELRKLINSPEVFSLLAEGDWGAGGCWILAQALVDFLGPPAELVAVSETRARDLEDVVIPVSHVAVRFDDTYIDYNGAQTKSEFFDSLRREGYEEPEIHPWVPSFAREAERGGVPCDPRARKELLKHLVRRFGS